MNWKVDESKPHRYDHITNEMGDYVAVIYTSADDAHLMAAAPELLEVCKALLEMIQQREKEKGYADSYDVAAAAWLKSAIQKAEEGI